MIDHHCFIIIAIILVISNPIATIATGYMVAIGIIAYFSGALPQCTFTFVAVSTIMIDIGIIAIIASFSGALPQCTFTNKNPTAAGALADYCQFLRQNPFMVIIATHSWFLPLLLLLSVPQAKPFHCNYCQFLSILATTIAIAITIVSS